MIVPTEYVELVRGEIRQLVNLFMSCKVVMAKQVDVVLTVMHSFISFVAAKIIKKMIGRLSFCCFFGVNW